MKSNGSPCPQDQISKIAFKRSAYLRSYLTKIIQLAWCNRTNLEAWKRVVTILIYKKDSTRNPSNIRPVTLQSIPLRVFTSAVRNKLFVQLKRNNYIETNVQKGFTPVMTGTYEHTAQLAHIIRQAKKETAFISSNTFRLLVMYTTVQYLWFQTTITCGFRLPSCSTRPY